MTADSTLTLQCPVEVLTIGFVEQQHRPKERQHDAALAKVRPSEARPELPDSTHVDSRNDNAEQRTH